MRTAIVGGGAAGFFLAINLKELCPAMEVTILERGSRVLRKVEVSGGGRCNCTNTFEAVSPDLHDVYPRGYRLMKRLFRQFSPQDAFQWFESRGVRLTVQPDHCVFPQSQDSHTIINLFLSEARRLGVIVRTNTPVNSLEALDDYDFVAITTGGLTPHLSHLSSHLRIVPPVPSLFTFSISDGLTALMGTVVENAQATIPGTKLRASGPLLITHWGVSGPCILRLSSYAARELNAHGYRMPLSINWLGNLTEDDVRHWLMQTAAQQPKKLLPSIHPTELPQRLWTYLLEKHLGGRAHAPWGSLNQKEMNRLTNGLVNDQYEIVGRAPFKDEFVTCGGIDLSSLHPATLESKSTCLLQAESNHAPLHPRLFFAGEVLDIDGVTGGFNFQAAWTTAYVVATAISRATTQPAPVPSTV
jgi:hypothetical protein